MKKLKAILKKICDFFNSGCAFDEMNDKYWR